MLTIRTMPILLKIVGKLDISPIIPKLKGLDIFEEVDNAEDAVNQLSREKIGILALEILSDLSPQFGKIADDIPPLVAAYKNCSIKDAEEMDAAEVINEMINDDGIRSFFKTALRKKVATEA